MDFSPDGKTLAAQGGAPEWNLVLWIWEKTKVGSMIKSTNQQNMPVFQVRQEGNPHMVRAPLGGSVRGNDVSMFTV